LDVKRLPNALVLPSYPIGLALLGIAVLGDAGIGMLVRAVLGGLALFAAYFLLVLAHPGGMGFGDVKLAGVLGLYMAWLGWGAWAVGAFAAFLLGGLVGVLLMATGRAGRKSAVPFGPFMLAGALIAILAGPGLARTYVDLTLG
jgi:leader peptidase (prepilin peptidase)/N-methyltransferase